jgi:hypothetical protein
MCSPLQLVWVAKRVCMIQCIDKTAITNLRCSGTAGLIWMTIMVWFFMLAVIASMSVSLPTELYDPPLTILLVLRWPRWLLTGISFPTRRYHRVSVHLPG